MTELIQYPYSSADPTNGPLSVELGSVFLRLVSSLHGVRTVCDLGCGNGYISGRFLERGYEVVGVDASESGIAIASRVHGARGTFICAQCDATLPEKLNGRTFDAVISSDVVEHLYRPRDLLECARRLLSPGGWLVLGTPYHGYLKNLALSVLNLWDAHHAPLWDGGHIKFFSVRTLSALVETAGFELKEFHFVGRAPWLWKNMICVGRRR